MTCSLFERILQVHPFLQMMFQHSVIILATFTLHSLPSHSLSNQMHLCFLAVLTHLDNDNNYAFNVYLGLLCLCLKG